MSKRRTVRWLLVVLLILVLGALASPWLVRAYWKVRSSNPVRRGVQRATELGCFSCHGELGREGIPDPGEQDHDVPNWSGGVWMMYVESDQEIRDYILDGSAGREADGNANGEEHEPRRDEPAVTHDHEHDHADDQSHADRGEPAVTHDHEQHEIEMPAFRDVLGGTDLEDLVAAFKVLSGMTAPPRDSAARRGLEFARRWKCFSCHGPAGSGGLPNPGSFTGFIPGWYGPDFEDLVRDREEFDAWILEGSIPRLQNSFFASFFMRRQRLAMPAYKSASLAELDDLWAYVEWLRETEGGYDGVEPSW